MNGLVGHGMGRCVWGEKGGVGVGYLSLCLFRDLEYLDTAILW